MLMSDAVVSAWPLLHPLDNFHVTLFMSVKQGMQK